MISPKVLYISHSSIIAGAEKNLLSIIRSASLGGFEPAALILPERGPLSEKAGELDIPLGYVNYHAFRWYHPFKYFQTLWSLKRYVEEFQVDVIHLNLQTLAEFAVQAGRLTRRRVACHVRNLQSETTLAPLRPWLNRADAVLAVSQAVKDSLVERGIESHKVHLVYESIDGSYFHPPDQTSGLRRKYDLEESVRLVGFLGRVVPEKGVEDLIRATKIVLAAYPKIHVFIIGDDGQGGTYLIRLKEEIGALEMESQVTLLGFRNNVREILAELDIVVVPSRSSMPEGLPYAVLESLAAGKTVVATRNSGVPEVIEDGENGFLVDCDDVEGLASAMIHALELPEAVRSGIKSAARRSIQDRTIENQVRQLGRLYRRLLA